MKFLVLFKWILVLFILIGGCAPAATNEKDALEGVWYDEENELYISFVLSNEQAGEMSLIQSDAKSTYTISIEGNDSSEHNIVVDQIRTSTDLLANEKNLSIERIGSDFLKMEVGTERYVFERSVLSADSLEIIEGEAYSYQDLNGYWISEDEDFYSIKQTANQTIEISIENFEEPMLYVFKPVDTNSKPMMMLLLENSHFPVEPETYATVAFQDEERVELALYEDILVLQKSSQESFEQVSADYEAEQDALAWAGTYIGELSGSEVSTILEIEMDEANEFLFTLSFFVGEDEERIDGKADLSGNAGVYELENCRVSFERQDEVIAVNKSDCDVGQDHENQSYFRTE